MSKETTAMSLSRRDCVAVRLRRSLRGEGFSRRKKMPKGTVWPNGQFSVGWAYEATEVVGAKEEWAWTGGESRHLSNLVNPVKLSQPRRGVVRGVKGISGYGRKMVANAAYTMQSDVGVNNLGFATLTVPDMPDANRQTLARSWGEVTRQFQQHVGRMLTRSGARREVCYVTEVCPKRFESTGDVYLHIHMVFQSRVRGGGWALDANELREYWTELLSRISGYPIPGLARVKLEVVRRSAEGYIGKYMSKGGDVLREIVKEGLSGYLPSSWWGMTKELRDSLKRSVCKGFGLGERLLAVVDHFVSSEFQNSRDMYVLPVFLNLGGRDILSGWFGRISGDVRDWVVVAV